MPPIVASERRNAHFDYVTVGHVTRDVIEQPGGTTISQPGGGAFYSALQATRLGLRTLIITQGVPEEIQALLAPYLNEFEISVIPAEQTTVLAGPSTGSVPTQRVLSWAGAMVEPIELDARILHLAPIARETPTSWQGGHDFLGITPQGLIRHWQSAGEMSLVALEPVQLPDGFDAAVISELECPSCQTLFAAARENGALVAVTAGPKPTVIHLPAEANPKEAGPSSEKTRENTGVQVMQTVPPGPTRVSDDTGAGDVFAAAFFIALSEGRTPLDAATLGNSAAAVRIAGLGPQAIGGRSEIQQALTP